MSNRTNNQTTALPRLNNTNKSDKLNKKKNEKRDEKKNERKDKKKDEKKDEKKNEKKNERRDKPINLRPLTNLEFEYLGWEAEASEDNNFKNFNLIRIRTPCDGSCLFHALCKAYFK